MSVGLYDNSLIEDLRRITEDNRVTVTPYDRVFPNIAKNNYDEISFPLITITRTGWSIQGASQFMKFEGGLVKFEDLDDPELDPKIFRLQAIPIRINYLLDIWTRYREENDDIAREVIFYYTTHPTLSVDIGYGIDIKHNYNIFIDPDIEDNSDISDQPNHGEYFRQTLSIYTDDAYLWKASSSDPSIIDPDRVIVKLVDKI